MPFTLPVTIKVPKIPRPFMILITIIILSVSVLAIILITNPQGLPGMMGPDYVPGQESKDWAISELESGSGMELSFPLRTIYSPGDSFRVTMTMRNQFHEERTFYMDIIQESGPMGITPSFNELVGTLDPGETTTRNLEVVTLPTSPTGVYLYTVVACSDGPCADGREPYSQGKIVFRLI